MINIEPQKLNVINPAIGSAPSLPCIYTCFSHHPNGLLAEVVSPATIRAANEPAPSNYVCTSPGHAVSICKFK